MRQDRLQFEVECSNNQERPSVPSFRFSDDVGYRDKFHALQIPMRGKKSIIASSNCTGAEPPNEGIYLVVSIIEFMFLQRSLRKKRFGRALTSMGASKKSGTTRKVVGFRACK